MGSAKKKSLTSQHVKRSACCEERARLESHCSEQEKQLDAKQVHDRWAVEICRIWMFAGLIASGESGSAASANRRLGNSPHFEGTPPFLPPLLRSQC